MKILKPCPADFFNRRTPYLKGTYAIMIMFTMFSLSPSLGEVEVTKNYHCNADHITGCGACKIWILGYKNWREFNMNSWNDPFYLKSGWQMLQVASNQKIAWVINT